MKIKIYSLTFIFLLFFSFNLKASNNISIDSQENEKTIPSQGIIQSSKVFKEDVTNEDFIKYAFKQFIKSEVNQELSPFKIPPGSIIAYAGAIEPPGWLFCYGQAIHRSTYGALFQAIGILYGAGDGEKTFNIPDLNGRAIFGDDKMGGINANRITPSTIPAGVGLGSTAGKECRTLTIEEIPAHSHSYYTGTGEKTNYSGRPANAENSGNFQNLSTNSTGGGKPHNIMPPFIILNYMIKY